MQPQLRRNNSASCGDKTRGKACRHHNRAGAVKRGDDNDNDDENDNDDGGGEGVGWPTPLLPVSAVQ